MPKITFMGAGSAVFAKSILGDCMLTPALRDSHVALYDIDGTRLRDSRRMLDAINRNSNRGRAKITSHQGVSQRKKALRDADYVINAIQVGGYEPSTVIDFEVPKKYGLRQTIGDTLGIGGIFRALRTIPVMLDFARDMEDVCPDAWLLNYTNPMAMITGAVLKGSSVKAVGLCHSVQSCALGLLIRLRMKSKVKDLRWKIAGINHQGWLLEIRDGTKDIYPMVKERARQLLERERKKTGKKNGNLIRYHIMLTFGYYVTESSEHSAEYVPWYIKSRFPELIEEFNIPLDEYPRRCRNLIERWKQQRKDLAQNPRLTHERRTAEYGSHIIEAIETDRPFQIGGNVLNTGLIPNLPPNCCVEVPCMVDGCGVRPCYVGDLPEQCAAINRTSINVQQLAIDAALTRKRDAIYHAAMLDPHTAAELTIDRIRDLCDDLIAAHGKVLPKYR